MKRIIFFVFIVLFFVTDQQALANEVGDVGSPECLTVQNDAQETVIFGAPYRNHGQIVSTAANVVSPEVDSGEITEECSSCIMNQIARRIPIEEQEPCGEPAAVCPCWDAELLNAIVRDLIAPVCFVVENSIIFTDGPLTMFASLNYILNNCEIRDDEYGIDRLVITGLSDLEMDVCRETLLQSEFWALNCSVVIP